MLRTALECIARNWLVFPCKPGTKRPATRNGFKDASNDEATIRQWWLDNPEANVGIATGASGLTVLDVDSGIANEAAAAAFCEEFGDVYAVRTGRRPGFGLQLYFQGGDQQSIPWKRGGLSGDVRSATGYVIAAGSRHPSGELYEVINDAPIDRAPPQWVRSLKRPETKHEDGTLRQLGVGDGQHDRMTHHAGRFRALGYDGDQILAALLPLNEIECNPPLPESDIESIAYGVASRYAAGQAETATVSIGGKKEENSEADPLPDDWRLLFHSQAELANAPDPEFLIDGFLLENGITGLAALPAQRKSFIASNVIESLLTGSALFGSFEVVKQPAKVVYLCPEMSINEVAGRFRDLGLLPFVGNRLFCRTMDSEIALDLPDIPEEALAGSFVVIDTAIRFLTGDENSSEHMRAFTNRLFDLRTKSVGVLVLYHAPKGSGEAQELTLENCLRGSGELAAALTTCWGTRIQAERGDVRNALSYVKNVKPRVFASLPFLLRCDENGRMSHVPMDGEVKLSSKSPDKLAKEKAFRDYLRALIAADPDASQSTITDLMNAAKFRTSKSAVQRLWSGVRLELNLPVSLKAKAA